MKQKFLLHTCCAPCGIAVIDELRQKCALTVFFYNPNIYPEAEYLKRKAEVVRICAEWGVPMVNMDYDAQEWHDKVAKGLEMVAEGGERCLMCFKFRLSKAAQYAAERGFQYYGTTLTMGRNKKTDVIHPIGVAAGGKYVVRFYEEDWKKSGRQEKAKRMVEEKGIYRQRYCGCKYSQKA